MQDKTQLGIRFICFQCGCKFYDLNKPEPICPECEADQRQAPEQDIKALLSSGKGRKKAAKEEAPEPKFASDAAKDETKDEGLLGGFESTETADKEEEEEEEDK